MGLLHPGTRIHDPFAGEGVRLGSMATRQGLTFTGTEIEPAFIGDERVAMGDATDPATYPPTWLCPTCGDTGGPGMHLDKRPLLADPNACNISMCRDLDRHFTIVTSPVYPNGMADDFIPRDLSRRRTYTAWLCTVTGRKQHLASNNMGRWGYRGRKLDSTARAMYWHLAEGSVAHWGGAERVLLNVSDFIATDGEKITRQVPVVREWQALLRRHGWTDQFVIEVPTRRWRDGANRELRVETEVVIDARR